MPLANVREKLVGYHATCQGSVKEKSFPSTAVLSIAAFQRTECFLKAEEPLEELHLKYREDTVTGHNTKLCVRKWTLLALNGRHLDYVVKSSSSVLETSGAHSTNAGLIIIFIIIIIILFRVTSAGRGTSGAAAIRPIMGGTHVLPQQHTHGPSLQDPLVHTKTHLDMSQHRNVNNDCALQLCSCTLEPCRRRGATGSTWPCCRSGCGARGGQHPVQGAELRGSRPPVTYRTEPTPCSRGTNTGKPSGTNAQDSNGVRLFLPSLPRRRWLPPPGAGPALSPLSGERSPGRRRRPSAEPWTRGAGKSSLVLLPVLGAPSPAGTVRVNAGQEPRSRRLDDSPPGSAASSTGHRRIQVHRDPEQELLFSSGGAGAAQVNQGDSAESRCSMNQLQEHNLNVIVLYVEIRRMMKMRREEEGGRRKEEEGGEEFLEQCEAEAHF
ncbi:unnamed protein product [Pleuronectes platessa]|uniref:Uncharacterized protein n=1 Tax=Pleuronectes platessa TaxID=8262 RepID=A0A9N7UKY8_PLEPL|nr:unnamed protein product [Pleuronectes platessa]